MTRNGNSINRRPQAIYPLRNLYDTRLGRAEVAGDEVETPHTERLASAIQHFSVVGRYGKVIDAVNPGLPYYYNPMSRAPVWMVD